MSLYRFSECELDAGVRTLTCRGEIQTLEPRVFDLLLLLVSQPETVFSREQLLGNIWQDKIVTDSSVDVAISHARKAVGDSGKNQAIIKTVPRRGFRLSCDVVCVDTDVSESQLSITMDRATEATAVNYKPVVAIIQFESFGLNADQTYLTRGLADDLATELSRNRYLSVISTWTTFQFSAISQQAHSADTPSAFARHLGATHLVSGHLERNRKTLTLSVRLDAVGSNSRVWSERYQLGGEDSLSIRDEIVRNIAGTLLGRMETEIYSAGLSRHTTNLTAYDCLMRGLTIFKSGEVSTDINALALQWFDKAIEQDPDLVRARAWRCCAASNFWSNPPTDEEVEYDFDSLQHALNIDPNDHEVHHIMGAMQHMICNRDLAQFHFSRSLELNPNDARILLRTGFFRSFLDDLDNAMETAQLGFVRNPLHPPWYWNDFGIVLFAHRRYEEAYTCLCRGYEDIEINLLYKLAAAVGCNRKSEVRKLLRQIVNIKPDINLDWVRTAYPWRCYYEQDDLENFVELVGLGGVPG